MSPMLTVEEAAAVEKSLQDIFGEDVKVYAWRHADGAIEITVKQ